MPLAPLSACAINMSRSFWKEFYFKKNLLTQLRHRLNLLFPGCQFASVTQLARVFMLVTQRLLVQIRLDTQH